MSDLSSPPPSAFGQPLTSLALGPLQASEPGQAWRELAGLPPTLTRGHWLRVRLAASAQPWLVAVGDAGRWPDLTVPAEPSGSGWRVWVYVGLSLRALRLVGLAAQVQATQCLGGELFENLPAGAEATLAMRTAERLEQLGVRELRGLVIEPDTLWPLRSTGPDPQLRFERLGGVQPWRLTFTLRAAPDIRPPAPVAYWVGGRTGYDATHSTACKPLDAAANTFCATLPAGVRWRLDPLAEPGRFSLDNLQVTPAPATPVTRWLGRSLQRLRDLRPWRGTTDMHPVHQLQAIGTRPGYWLATGDDPQWLLPGRLAAGWYMLELTLGLPAARAMAMAYLDEGSGPGEHTAQALRVSDGRCAKRLLWLPRPATLRLDPMAAPGTFELRHFRLCRVSTAFAADRMRRKLAAAGIASDRRGAPTEALWRDYRALFSPHPHSSAAYADWIAATEQPALPDRSEQAHRATGWSWCPRISVLLPVYDPDPDMLAACLASVQAQTYPNWQLCIADDASTDPRVRSVLDEAAARDARLRVAYRERNGHIAACSNTALGLAEGEFIALLDHDDTLAPHALFSIAEALQQRPTAQILYSDEDKLDSHGHRCDPFFKPDWSPDLLRAQNFVGHLATYRRELVQSVGGFRPGFDGSQDYDLLLRCAAQVGDPADIVHVPRVLYHWRKTAASTATAHAQKPYATEAARRALQERADAAGCGVQVEVVAPGLYRDRWPLPDPAPLVTLIVPTRDRLDLLRPCIESVLRRTTYPNYEILVVDNRSREPATLEWLDQQVQRHSGRLRVVPHDAPFNFAAINNAATAQARGDLLGLLNNDVEVLSPGWLGELVSHAMRADVGCVGAKLYYPDHTIQHAGVVLGIGGVAGHSHKYAAGNSDGYFNRLRAVHEVSAVTAAVLVVRKSVWYEAGGMDASDLQVAFNDVDFCLKVRALGYRNLVSPWAELVHHESKTRGADNDAAKRERFVSEVRTMQARWGRLLQRDPYYNPNLTMVREDYSLGAISAIGELR